MNHLVVRAAALVDGAVAEARGGIEDDAGLSEGEKVFVPPWAGRKLSGNERDEDDGRCGSVAWVEFVLLGFGLGGIMLRAQG